ncbi:MAG: hypothetical protein KAI24_04585, partial [Planctomycetes bacterium]|nr:hypothetical protein [Planctomycetota bacterium]
YVWVPLAPGDNLVVDFTIWSVADTGSQTPDSQGHYWYFRIDSSFNLPRAHATNYTTSLPANASGVDSFGAKLGFLLWDGQFVAHEGSCAGSSGAVPTIGANAGTWPQTNSSFDVTLTDGPANSFASLILSTETSNHLGVPLPLDMGVLGATGCTFWQGWEVALPGVATDALGGATTTLQFPPAFPTNIRFYGTWITLDGNANAFGIVPSGFATMSL